MKKLLVGSTFDRFYMVEAEVDTFASFSIDGKLNKAYYNTDEQETMGDRRLSLWSDIKPMALLLMKGKKLPVAFRIVLMLSDENTQWLLNKYHLESLGEVLSGLYINIRYQDGKLSCVTGLSFSTFVMDKRLTQLWDETAMQFMRQNGIVVS